MFAWVVLSTSNLRALRLLLRQLLIPPVPAAPSNAHPPVPALTESLMRRPALLSALVHLRTTTL
jgi:hypothetical protein